MNAIFNSNVVLPSENCFNEQGFLNDYTIWHSDLAKHIALAEQIELSLGHWELIYTFREINDNIGHIPIMRVLSKILSEKLGTEKATMFYLTSLFGENPLRKICKIAGLPKPRHCL